MDSRIQIAKDDSESGYLDTSIQSGSESESGEPEPSSEQNLIGLIKQNKVISDLNSLFDSHLLRVSATQDRPAILVVLMVKGLVGAQESDSKLLPDDSAIRHEMEKVSLLFGDLPSYLQNPEETQIDPDESAKRVLDYYQQKTIRKSSFQLLKTAGLAEGDSGLKELGPKSHSLQSKLKRLFGLILRNKGKSIEGLLRQESISKLGATRSAKRVSSLFATQTWDHNRQNDCSSESFLTYFNFWRIQLFINNNHPVLDECGKFFLSSVMERLVETDHDQLEKQLQAVFEGVGTAGGFPGRTNGQISRRRRTWRMGF